jgi:CDGSH-type Zn-finger protein
MTDPCYFILANVMLSNYNKGARMPVERKITISKNGPYLVTGSVPIAPQTIKVNKDGESTAWIAGEGLSTPAAYALCRCGESKTKPFCDGTHKKIDFDGTEIASYKTVLEQAKIIDGPNMQLADAEHLCASARFCDPNGQVWSQVTNCDDDEVRSQFIHQVGMCPSGRLLAIDKATGKSVEPQLPQSIGVIEDPAEGSSGPLWVRGGIPVVGADGQSYEIRNRLTLCRCGRSQNKPFCNGAHAVEPKFEA